MRSPTRSLDYPSTAQSCGHEYCWHGHRPHVRWWNSVGRPYHTDCNGQSIHKVGVTRYGIKLLSCVFQCSLKGPQSYNMYKNPPLGFLMLFCHVFIDAPEKLPKFGAFSTLGTALNYRASPDFGLIWFLFWFDLEFGNLDIIQSPAFVSRQLTCHKVGETMSCMDQCHVWTNNAVVQ